MVRLPKRALLALAPSNSTLRLRQTHSAPDVRTQRTLITVDFRLKQSSPHNSPQKHTEGCWRGP